jgi:mRNA-degrading endonuclease toxin of MazEF toxin-antitoxin module
VVQNDVFNRSHIGTVVVCGLSSTLRLAGAPGNVLLEAGEANLPKRSVVNVSQVYTLDKEDLLPSAACSGRSSISAEPKRFFLSASGSGSRSARSC